MDATKAAYLIGLTALSAGIATTAGCDLGDVVRTRTPVGIQTEHGLPQTMTLNEAEAAYAAWLDDTKRHGAEWKASIDKANEVRGLLGQLTLQQLDTFGPTLAGVPVVGASLPALAGLAGLFVGTSRLRREKEASFNSGLKKGAATVKTA